MLLSFHNKEQTGVLSCTPVFAAVVSKTIVGILSVQFHFLSKLMTEFAIRSPTISELATGRAGAPRSFISFDPKKLYIYINWLTRTVKM